MPDIEPDTTSHDRWDALPFLLSVPRAAALLGISRSAGYRLAESGELPTRRMGGRLYVITARLQALLEQDDLGEAAA
ncbi:DNA binding domain, excisionase family [Nocardia otitidiscaviarum]|uniref:DNA binding domain, excisionase family n=1 Tax=Nocardia otitidiscaviarum TaxID=1823 RepID=A0A378Y909_9NOCA|nr:helix-turn-helix domain-containing protein [Nocardia otitidiscaviarum]MBF6241531.1 helix-turn-helix domain-containing protein [Nocardia otitidiscaviarum]SUA72849.1 DNA binding domain, excisionase family [Nocardia otitidiscaviarum]